jgi:hypothetical protein
LVSDLLLLLVRIVFGFQTGADSEPSATRYPDCFCFFARFVFPFFNFTL